MEAISIGILIASVIITYIIAKMLVHFEYARKYKKLETISLKLCDDYRRIEHIFIKNSIKAEKYNMLLKTLPEKQKQVFFNKFRYEQDKRKG